MKDTEILKAQFDEDGFVVIPGFLETSELAEVIENLDQYIREIVPTLAPEDAFYQDRSKPETL